MNSLDEKQIKELLSKLISYKESKKNVLLIFTGADHYSKEVEELFIHYQDKCNYLLIFSDACKRNFDTDTWKSMGSEIVDFTQFRKIIDQIDMVLLPFLTRNSLAKIALGIADTLPLLATQHCILSGENIIAFENSWDVNNEIGKIQGLNKNATYIKMLNQYKKQLTEFGVISVPLSEAKQKIDQKLFNLIEEQETNQLRDKYVVKEAMNKNILTLKDVIDNPSIDISSEVKMTDLARDYLRDKRKES
ncbi:hypothetical protein D1839_00935 [Roseburia sp. 1XD42-34]|nr:hypothetical protein [Roseburia sp. 1XD42-34]RKI82482.1 hypothetical protein D7V87_00935 [Clostridium sp. 1xD42-85]